MKGNNKQLSCCGGDVVVVGRCKVSRRSTGTANQGKTAAPARKAGK
jgi:hypothetical protein